MTQLDGSSRRVELEPGYALIAPGLFGVAMIQPARAPHTRGGGTEQATAAFDDAMELASFEEVRSIVIDAQPQPVPRHNDLRSADGEPALALEIPDQGPDVGQVVMLIDEAGVITWHYPEPLAESRGTRRGVATRRFVLRRYAPPQPLQPGANRGLFGFIGRKVLKVLVYPMLDPVLGRISDGFAERWEAKHRPYGVLRMDPDTYTEGGAPLSPEDWEQLATGRTLLFVHGTFSTARAAFGGLPKETMAGLARQYDGRVVAFNHFSLSHSPQENARWFVQNLPALSAGGKRRFDIVCHSRGGLVARSLAAEAARDPELGTSIERIIFVAAPNHGTALAHADHMVQFLDRYTTMLNLVPPGPASIVTEVLEGVLIVVKIVGHAALGGLPGLLAMHPDKTGELADADSVQAFGIAADFEPTPAMRHLVRLVDGVADRVFDTSDNDLVVPTDGVYQGSESKLFPIPLERVLRLESQRGIWHGGFFACPEVGQSLRNWLASGGLPSKRKYRT